MRRKYLCLIWIGALGSTGLAASGCAGGPEARTLPELIKENTRIIEQLASYRPEEQRQGLERFRRLGKEQGSEVVAWFIGDEKVSGDERVRVLLAILLAEWEDPRGISHLIESLSSRDQGVVRFAVDGLIIYGERPSIIEALGEKLASSQRETRLAAARILSRMRGARSLELLGERLRSREEEDVEIRGQCLLGVQDGARSSRRIDYLIDVLTDPDAGIRAHAWAVLRGEKGVPPVYEPGADLAARAQGVSDLRRWAGRGRR